MDFGTSMFFINGSVAGKVELKNLSDGTPVARFKISVCVEEGRTEKIPVAVWGELAEKAAYLLYDGAMLSVMGTIIERDGKPVLAGRKIDFCFDTDAAVKKEKKSKAQKPAKDKDDEDDGYDDEDDDSDDLDFFKSNNESGDESEDSEDDDSDSEDEYDDDDDDAFPF